MIDIRLLWCCGGSFYYFWIWKHCFGSRNIRIICGKILWWVCHFGSETYCCRCPFFIMLCCLPMLLILYWISLLLFCHWVLAYLSVNALPYRICSHGQYADICMSIWIYFLACGLYAAVKRTYYLFCCFPSRSRDLQFIRMVQLELWIRVIGFWFYLKRSE